MTKFLRIIPSGMTITLLFMAVSCTTFSKISIQKFQVRRYRLCQDFEVKDPVGKACFRYCERYERILGIRTKKCKEDGWKTEVMDLRVLADFIKFRNAGFVLSAEQTL